MHHFKLLWLWCCILWDGKYQLEHPSIFVYSINWWYNSFNYNPFVPPKLFLLFEDKYNPAQSRKKTFESSSLFNPVRIKVLIRLYNIKDNKALTVFAAFNTELLFTQTNFCLVFLVEINYSTTLWTGGLTASCPTGRFTYLILILLFL